MGKFKKGLFLGGLLGAGLTWLNGTKKGKEVRDDLLDHAKKGYVQLSTELKSTDAWQQMSEHEYVQRVEAFVDRYVRENGLGEKVHATMTKLLKEQWNRFKSDTRDDV